MVIGSRHIGIRRRWLLVASLVWMAIVYVAWMFFYAPGGAAFLERAKAQCEAIDGPYSYGHATCLQLAAQLSNAQQANVAATATWVAILPVVVLWAVWLGRRLLRECRAIECTKRIA